MNWSEFFAMGGYGIYVWNSYALAAVILMLNVYLPLRRRRVLLRMLHEFLRLKGQSK